MKPLDRRAEAYVRSVARQLPIRGQKRTAYLRSLRQDADEYLRTHPWDGAEALAARFGEPREIAVTFVSEMTWEEINSRFRARNRVIGIALTVAAAALTLLAAALVLIIVRNALDMGGYAIITGA